MLGYKNTPDKEGIETTLFSTEASIKYQACYKNTPDKEGIETYHYEIQILLEYYTCYKNTPDKEGIETHRGRLSLFHPPRPGLQKHPW